jgi:hypothetical protein
VRGRNRHPGHPRTPAGTRQRRVGGSAGRAGKHAGAKKHTDERDGKCRNLCLEARSTRWLRCLRSSRRAHPKAHEDLRHGRFHEMDFMKWISSNSAVRQDHEGLLWRPSKAGSRITAHKASLGIPRGSRARNPLPIASLSPSFFSRIASALPLTASFDRLHYLIRDLVLQPLAFGFCFLQQNLPAVLLSVLRRTSGTKCLSGTVAHFPKDMALVSDNPGPKSFISEAL